MTLFACFLSSADCGEYAHIEQEVHNFLLKVSIHNAMKANIILHSNSKEFYELSDVFCCMLNVIKCI
jgi:hypothetical protein